MAGGLDRLMAPGRHTRRQRQTGLRRVSVALLIMLVIQYGLGIFLNLYVAVPASDAHAGIFQKIATAPPALTVHVLLGLALIGTAILLVARAFGERDRVLAVLATAGLTAIGGAFGAGEIFVKNGQATASLAMAILTGVALLCYVGTLALASAAQWQATIPELVPRSTCPGRGLLRRHPLPGPRRRRAGGPSSGTGRPDRAGRPSSAGPPGRTGPQSRSGQPATERAVRELTSFSSLVLR